MARRVLLALALLVAAVPTRAASATSTLTFSGTLRVRCARYAEAAPLVVTDPRRHVYDCDSTRAQPTAALEGTVVLDGGSTGRLGGGLYFDCVVAGSAWTAAGDVTYEAAGAVSPLSLAMSANVSPVAHVMSDGMTGVGVTTFGPAMVPPQDAAGLCAYPTPGAYYYVGTVDLVTSLTFTLTAP